MNEEGDYEYGAEELGETDDGTNKKSQDEGDKNDSASDNKDEFKFTIDADDDDEDDEGLDSAEKDEKALEK